MNSTAKMTIHEPPAESPTAQILAKTAVEHHVKDSRGRLFTIKKPGILTQYRIIEVMGKSADIDTYRGMVTPLIFITAIEGDPIAIPVNKIQLEGLIQRVGDEGLEAVTNGIVEHFGTRAADPDADRESIKK